MMGEAKRAVSNKSRPEGSICTFHLHREITYFCSHYFKDECSLSNNSSGTILVMETMLSRRGCQCWTKSDVLLGHVETILLPTPSGLLLMCMSLSIAQKLNHISSKWISFACVLTMNLYSNQCYPLVSLFLQQYSNIGQDRSPHIHAEFPTWFRSYVSVICPK